MEMFKLQILSLADELGALVNQLPPQNSYHLQNVLALIIVLFMSIHLLVADTHKHTSSPLHHLQPQRFNPFIIISDIASYSHIR